MEKGEYEVLPTLKNTKIIPIERGTYEQLLQLTSGRVYDPMIERLPDGTYEVKYTKKTGTDEMTFIFPHLDEKEFKWIVKKVKRKTKQGEKEIQEVVNFDELARKVMLIELLFAYGTGSSHFVYRPWDMLYWLKISDRKKGILRDRVAAITHALALAAVIIKDKTGKETKITHIMTLVDRGKGRNRELEVSLWKDGLFPLWPELMKQLKKEGKLPPFVRQPTAKLAYNPRGGKYRKYAENFAYWARKHEGMGTRFWPIKIETLLIKAMRMTPKQVKQHSKKELEDILLQAQLQGKRHEVVIRWYNIPNSEKLSKSQWLKSKIRLEFPRREMKLLRRLGSADKAPRDVPGDTQITEIADWLHDEEFGTKRSYKTSVKMLKEAQQLLGEKRLQETFNWVSEDSYNPHPKLFWEEIEKEFKKCG